MISSSSTILRESVIVIKKLLNVAATSESFDLVLPSSNKVIRHFDTFLSEIKGLKAFQIFLLYQTAESSS